MHSSIELLASYQGHRSKVLKNKRVKQNITFDDFLSPEETYELLSHRGMSRIISHCNYAINSIGFPVGEKIDDEQLSQLPTLEQCIVKLVIEDRKGYQEIEELYPSLQPAEIERLFKTALRKLTKHIRDSNPSKN